VSARKKQENYSGLHERKGHDGKQHEKERLDDSAVLSDVAKSTISYQKRKDLQKNLNGSGIYVLYRDDQPYYIGKTINKTLIERLSQHALKPNARYYNFWNYFSAFQIAETIHRDEIEAILISAMPTALSSHPKFPRRKLDRQAAKMLNNIQAMMLTGTSDQSGEPDPEVIEEEEA
jgi:hypothetical protein